MIYKNFNIIYRQSDINTFCNNYIMYLNFKLYIDIYFLIT